MNLLREGGSLVGLVQLFRRERPSLVHSFTAKGVLFGSLAAHLAGVERIVNSITGLGYVFISDDVRARMMRPVIERWYRTVLNGSAVIFQNTDDRRYFETRGLVSGPSYFIPGSGVDTDVLRPAPEPEGTPIVLLAGRMLWDKGIDVFVEAARQLRSEGSEARFVLAGDTDDGNPSSVPKAQLEAWQAEGAVEWWGFQRDIASLMANSQVVCLPSLREGVPRALIEAGALGRPLVATDTPGCREIVRHGDNGLLVPVQDAPALARALARLLAERDLRRQMGQRARQIVEDDFSIVHVARRTLAVYDELCSNAG